MKIIILTLILTLITFSYQRESVSKNSRKISSSTDKNRKKLTDNKNSCPPGVYPVTINFLSSNPTELNVNLDAKIDVRNLNPISNTLNTKGLIVAADAIPDNLKTFFYTDNGLTLLLFKHFSDSFQGISSLGKSIVSKFRSADFKDYTITISFAYDSNWETINDSDIAKIVSWLNDYMNLKFKLLQDSKIYIQEELSYYLGNKTLADKWSNDKSAKEAEITKLTQANTQLSSDITKYQQEKKTAETENLKKQAELSDANAKRKKNEDDIALEKGTLEELKKQIIDHQNLLNNAFQDEDYYKNKVNKAIEEIQKINLEYNEECADKAVYLTKGLSLLKEKTVSGKNDEALKNFKENLALAFGQK